MSNMNEEKEKAYNEYSDRSKIVVSAVWFSAGFDAGVRVERGRIKRLLHRMKLCGVGLSESDWNELFPQEPQQEGER